MIEINNVSVLFKNKKSNVAAVDNVSLKINDGEIFGIVGHSGAGKSTLVRVINLLQKPTEGEVLIDGVDMTKLNRKELRQKRLEIGMIFQHFNLIKGKTIAQNIEFVLKADNYPKDKREARITELLSLVNLLDKKDSYPENLSGGQKQRAGIARAIANNPKILLCDEATSALDLENTEEVVNLLRDINEKTKITIVFITHEMDVAKRLFDRAAVMDNGKIIEVNNVYDLFASPQHEVTRALVNRNSSIELPREILKKLDKGEILKVTYKGDNSFSAVISKAIKKFNVDINIIHGRIDYISNKPIGNLIINITGLKDEINRAKKFIQSNAVETERIINEYMEVI